MACETTTDIFSSHYSTVIGRSLDLWNVYEM